MLSDESLIEILTECSFRNSLPTASIQRKTDLPIQLVNDLVLMIQGVSRSGKSTLLSQIPDHYKIPLNQCYFCNFEDPRLMNDLNHNLLSRIVKLIRQKITSGTPCYFFFDEIQNVEAWEKWLHTQVERPKNNFFIVSIPIALHF